MMHASMAEFKPGLEGVVAGETAISTLEGGLHYRGYSVQSLAAAASFEEVAYLLLNGDLPRRDQLVGFSGRLADARKLPRVVTRLMRDLPPDAPAMDVLRSAVSVLAHVDPDLGDSSANAETRKAERLLGAIPAVIAAWARIRRGEKPARINPKNHGPAQFLLQLTGQELSAGDVRAFEVAQILYAEHEFNASTFTCRVVASTQSDLYSAVTAGIGALKGSLHGGANEQALRMLQQWTTADEAVAGVRAALARKEKFMGFGHRVYRDGDPRARLLAGYCRQMAQERDSVALEAIAAAVEETLAKAKGIYPNLDWPAARLYHMLGIDTDLYTPLFAASRVAGWCAHIMEQRAHNRIYRPRSNYTGPAHREIEPMHGRIV